MDIRHNHRTSCGDHMGYSPQSASADLEFVTTLRSAGSKAPALERVKGIEKE
jgi:hypothetical protein